MHLKCLWAKEKFISSITSSQQCQLCQFYGQNSTFESDIVSPSFLVYKHHQVFSVIVCYVRVNHLVFKDKKINKVNFSHFLRPDLLPSTDASVMHPMWTAGGHSTAYWLYKLRHFILKLSPFLCFSPPAKFIKAYKMNFSCHYHFNTITQGV